MLKIAALDDEPNYLAQIQKATEEYFRNANQSYQFCAYKTAESLLIETEKDDIDIYLLDVQLNESAGTDNEAGIKVAKKIRERDPYCGIVYITNYIDYAPAVFEVNAYRYILKQKLEEELPRMYDSLCPKLLQRKERYYTVKTDHETVRMGYRDILYMRKEKKYVVFYLKNGKSFSDRTNLETVEKKLDEKEFVRIDKGCIVNLNHVESVNKQTCELRDGTTLPICQARSREVKDKLAELLCEISYDE